MIPCGRRDGFAAGLRVEAGGPIISFTGLLETRLPLYAFDDVLVDTAAFRVERAGVLVPLEPKAFDLLVLLLERSGQLVTKQEILDAVWPRTAVSDNALTRIVAHLRKALGDDARDARYIDTVPPRGYRFGAAVARLEEPPRKAAAAGPSAHPAPAPIVAPPSSSRPVRVFALAVLAVAAVALSVRVAQGWRVSRAVPHAEARAGGEARVGPGGIAVLSLWPTQVTVSPGLDAFPSLAPNGRALAYSSDRGGTFEIVVRALAGGAAETALTSDGEQNVEPAWSPDGGSIAYHSMRRGGIWVVPALGGVPRRLSEFGSDPAWSPDGRRLAFQSDPLADIGPMAYGANIPSTIWTVDADGGNARRVTSSAHPVGGHAAPAWSPDGARIVFITYSAAPSRLWSVPAAGGAPTLLAEAHGAMFDPVFAPDGTSVYYATGGPFVIRVPLSADGARTGGEPEALATPGLVGVRHLSLSADGRRLAMASLSLKSNLWTQAVSPRTGEAQGDPAPLTDDIARRKTTPVFSPDGRWIAYTTSVGGAGTAIWVIGASGGPSTPLVAGDPPLAKVVGGANFRPSWFPDSVRMAFLSNDGERTTLQVADLVTRRPERLLELGPIGPADDARRAFVNPALDFRLSPDTRQIVYSEIDATTGLPRVYVRPRSGGDPRPLGPGDRAETYPVWSHDGRWIATELRNERGTQIAVRSVIGGPARVIGARRGEAWVHDWTPDERVVFAGLRGGVWNVYVASPASGEETRVTSYGGVSTFVRYPTWSPRGDRVVYERGDVSGNIWVALLTPGPNAAASGPAPPPAR